MNFEHKSIPKNIKLLKSKNAAKWVLRYRFKRSRITICFPTIIPRIVACFFSTLLVVFSVLPPVLAEGKEKNNQFSLIIQLLHISELEFAL